MLPNLNGVRQRARPDTKGEAVKVFVALCRMISLLSSSLFLCPSANGLGGPRQDDAPRIETGTIFGRFPDRVPFPLFDFDFLR